MAEFGPHRTENGTVDAGETEMTGKTLLMLIRLFACGWLLLDALAAAAVPQEGMPAPAVRAELLDGGSFDSAQLLGKVVVVNFWAS